jgi:hypothetical protein
LVAELLQFLERHGEGRVGVGVGGFLVWLAADLLGIAFGRALFKAGRAEGY